MAAPKAAGLQRALGSGASIAGRVLTSPYYLLNLAIICSYVLLRRNLLEDHVDIKSPLKPRGSSFFTLHAAPFPQLESQIGVAIGLTCLARSYRSSSLDAVVATVLNFSQLFVLLVTALADQVAFVQYALAFGLVLLLCNEPAYSGTSKVEALTAQQFQDHCRKDTNSDVAYAVMLHTAWSARCRHTYPLFAELSNRYATDKLQFKKLDVGTWPHIAKALDVDISSTSSQLPTVLLFHAGQEQARVPGASKAALRHAAKVSLSRVDIINALDLDVRYANSMASKGPSGSSS